MKKIVMNKAVDPIVRNTLTARLKYALKKEETRRIEMEKQNENEIKQRGEDLLKLEEIIKIETELLVSEVKNDFIKQLQILLSSDKNNIRDRKIYYQETAENHGENILKINYYDSTILDTWSDSLDGNNFYVLEKKVKENTIYDDEYIKTTFYDLLKNICKDDSRKDFKKQIQMLPKILPIDLLLPKIIIKFLDENKRFDYYNNVFVNPLTPLQIAMDFQDIYFSCIDLLKSNIQTSKSTFSPTFLYKYQVYENTFIPFHILEKKIKSTTKIHPKNEKDIQLLIDNQDFERVCYYPLSLYRIDDILEKTNDEELINNETRVFFMKVHAFFIEEYVETYRSYQIIDPLKIVVTLKEMIQNYQLGFMKYKYLFFGETFIGGVFQKTHEPKIYSSKKYGKQLLLYYLVYQYCYDTIFDRIENRKKRKR